MNEFIIEEGNLRLKFTNCCEPRKFDLKNYSGLSAVDIIVEKSDSWIYLEVKDYQNPNAPPCRRETDWGNLLDAAKTNKSDFSIEMGRKIRDSLLQVYAEGGKFAKSVVFLIFINLDKLKSQERRLLYEKIKGYIPTGLNDDRFVAFKNVSFRIVDAEKLKDYGITCESKAEK